MTKLMTRNPSALRAALLGGVAVFAFAGMPATAHAQDADTTAEDGEFDGNVIIVQARRQDETLQEVPVTVTAISGEVLEKYGVDQVADVVGRVPTLNVQVGGSGSGGQLSLRGVGSSNISAAFDSAVAFDFDGVQVSTMRLVQAGFFDTAQIDVLKGPQSLFFGKSASAGVFSIRSADPTSTWEIGAKGSYEFEEKGYVVGGYISGPLSDSLGIRLAAQYNDIDEFVELQPGTPAVNQFRGQKNFVGRATIDWEPTPGFNANLKVQYVKNEGDGAIQTMMAANAPVLIQRAMVQGHPDEGVLPSGQAAANIDRLPPVAEVIAGIVAEAQARLDALTGTVTAAPSPPRFRAAASKSRAGARPTERVRSRKLRLATSTPNPQSPSS